MTWRLVAILAIFSATLVSCGNESGGKQLECIATEFGKCFLKFKYDEQNRIVEIYEYYHSRFRSMESLNWSHTLRFIYGDRGVVTVDFGGGINRDYAKNGKTITVNGMALGEEKFTINGDGFIAQKNGNIYEYKKGNLVGIKADKKESLNGIDYEYDDKKSPFFGSKTPKWILQYFLEPYYAGKNNVVRSELENGGTLRYEYDYDADGYPTAKWYSDGGEKVIIARYIYRYEAQNIPEEMYKPSANDKPLTSVKDVVWGIGKTNGNWSDTPPKYIVVEGSSGNQFNRAILNGSIIKIRYIGEKKREREEREMEVYNPPYETIAGAHYEILDHVSPRFSRPLFLYNSSEQWGGWIDRWHKVEMQDLKVEKKDIAALQKRQNGRKIIYSEIIADGPSYSNGGDDRLMLVRYQNTKKDGLFQIALRDYNNEYFTADFPSALDEYGKPNWRADMGDEIGDWSLYFAGMVAEGLFLVMNWSAAEGSNTEVFVAKNGKLKSPAEVIEEAAIQKSLEDAIVKTIKAFQNKDRSALDKLVLEDFGISLATMPGIAWVFSVHDKMPFDKIEETSLNYAFGNENFITDYNVRFEELPVFECEKEKWNKPVGQIYCDTTNSGLTRSGLAKMWNEYFSGDYSAADIKKWKTIENKSHTIRAVGKDGGVFIFHLLFWQGEWYLSMIESFEDCGGA